MWYQHVRLLFCAPFFQLAICNGQLANNKAWIAYCLLISLNNDQFIVFHFKMNAVGFKHTHNIGQVQFPADPSAKAFIGVTGLQAHVHIVPPADLSHNGGQAHVIEFKKAVLPGDDFLYVW
jgi:hypothetical protein